ncbi:MAG TPA: ribonuclease Y [Planctomycetota bacterium]|nr:ribonuclease Y [Planctomycetota bacterium]
MPPYVPYIVGAVAGLIIGWLIAALTQKNKSLEFEAQARKEAETVKQRLLDEARAEAAKLKAENAEEQLKKRREFDKELKDLQEENRNTEKRLEKREEMIDRKLQTQERREQDLARKEEELKKVEQKKLEQLKEIEAKNATMTQLIDEERRKLQTITSMTPDQAKALLLQRVERDIAGEIAELTNRAVNRAKENADQEARRIVLNTIQRLASEVVAENTVSTIDLPSDDMKGRIIGKEGRNIRAFEKATGVDVIVDDTPGVVVLSGFEPVRREIARIAMLNLVQDGRIHPTRIEECAAKAEKEVMELIDKTGKDVAIQFGCHDLHPRLRNMLGRLRYRTSYGQNVLGHSQEVAHICGLLAAELKLDVQLAKRCGLLHDCGKALDQETEGTHPQIGMDVAKQVEERIEVCEAIGGHHGDIEIHSLYPILVQIADAISAARPGARRESLEKYVQRMKKLEEIATTKKGIEKAFAIQAGREVRVLAKADQLDDAGCASVARDIAKQIEEELSYPGEVRVTLIREARFIEYAR